MSEFREGGCQCGQVRYRVGGAPIRVGLCYCGECRRHSGGPFSLNMIVTAGDFELLAGQVKRFTRTADSGRQVECAFCPDCGTRLFHVPTYLAGVINVKAGTLDDSAAVRPTLEIFADHKPDWLSIAGLTDSVARQP